MVNHRKCNDCGSEYKIEDDLEDLAVLASGMSREQAEEQCPICDSMNTEEVKES